MDKFNRNYILRIQGNDGSTITIEPPFSIEFDITRNKLSSANTASIRIYNLGKDTRNRMHKDQYEYDIFKGVALLGGYGNVLSILMSGNVQRCYSVRVGTEYVTTIESFDAGYAFANAQFKREYPKGTLVKSVYEDIIAALKPFGVELGVIGEAAGKLLRGSSLLGNPIEVLSELTSGNFFIDNGKAYILGNNEAIRGDIQVINSETGLLGTPVKENNLLEFEMLLEPGLIIGQTIKIESSTARSDYNGKYQVTSIKHSGIISESMAGRATTRISAIQGDYNEVLRI